LLSAFLFSEIAGCCFIIIEPDAGPIAATQPLLSLFLVELPEWKRFASLNLSQSDLLEENIIALGLQG